MVSVQLLFLEMQERDGELFTPKEKKTKQKKMLPHETYFSETVAVTSCHLSNFHDPSLVVFVLRQSQNTSEIHDEASFPKV